MPKIVNYLKLCTNQPRRTRYFVIQYNENQFRILKNKFQLDKGIELLKVLSGSTDKEEQERISLSRSKSRIRELVLCNDFEYFGTLTIDGYFLDRYELTDCQNKLKSLLKKIKRNNFDFKYLIITEKHKNNAYHFHGLFSGIDLVTNEFGYLHSDLFTKELGYNSFSKIKDNTKVANYITKYITKDCVKNSHNQVFIRSKNLRVATKEEINSIELGDMWKFENDYCCIYDLDLNNLKDNDKIVIQHLYSC